MPESTVDREYTRSSEFREGARHDPRKSAVYGQSPHYRRARRRSPAVRMAASTSSFRRPAPRATAPIRSSCLPRAGRPVSSVRWGLRPAK